MADNYRLERYRGSTVVSLKCGACGGPMLIDLGSLEGKFTCRKCDKIVYVPRISCNREGCLGHYVKCGGTIFKLEKEELAKNSATAWDGEPVGGGPTDSTHDDYGDIQGSIVTYKCTDCGVEHNAITGITRGYDHGGVRCEQIICSQCGLGPNLDDLSEHETYLG